MNAFCRLQCPENHGMFVRPTQLILLDDAGNPVEEAAADEKPRTSRLSRYLTRMNFHYILGFPFIQMLRIPFNILINAFAIQVNVISVHVDYDDNVAVV